MYYNHQTLGLYVAVGLTVQTGAVPEGIAVVGEGFSLGTYSTFTTAGITPPVCSLKLLCPITSKMLQFPNQVQISNAATTRTCSITIRYANSPGNGSAVSGYTNEGVRGVRKDPVQSIRCALVPHIIRLPQGGVPELVGFHEIPPKSEAGVFLVKPGLRIPAITGVDSDGFAESL